MLWQRRPGRETKQTGVQSGPDRAMEKNKALQGRYPAGLEKEEAYKQMLLLWLTDEFLYLETKGFYIAIQDKVVNTKNYRKHIIKDATTIDDQCRKCGSPT